MAKRQTGVKKAEKKKRFSKSVAQYPRLVREWHPTRNGDLRPQDVGYGSTQKIWWRCTRDRRHVWQATPNNRTNRTAPRGCPYCAGKLVNGTNSLAARHRELARQWHPTKNGELTPNQVPPGSDRRVWWQCEVHRSHQWRASISHRALEGTGCPFCTGKKVCETNSLAARYPGLAKQWHPTKNGTLTPAAVTGRSKRVVWWKCPKGRDHEWKTPIDRRAKAHDEGRPGCPFCAGYALSVTNRLSDRFPKIAREWHPTKNGELRPSDVVFGTPRQIWWRCPEDPSHEWRASPDQRTRHGTGCPWCSGRRCTPERSLAVRRPELAAQWHRKKNGKLRPREVSPYARVVVWWKCNKGPDHEWQQAVNDRSQTKGSCPFCRGTRVCRSNSLATRYPRVARTWHPTKNGDLTPKDVYATTRVAYWWKCPAGHAYRMSAFDRVALGRSCPACALGR